ncbi:MAG TPA: NAD(P)H-dependent oxidoreductase subunit E [Rectinemataceae bacterium]|nr:NAD(P)H-dependent oxidoreductase subunit E [Rectinemataceae bacterium]
MPDTPRFSAAALEELGRIIARYPEGRQKSALIPALHLAQRDLGGWLSVPVMDYVASLLSISPIEVYEVASFYTMFNTKPVGRFKLEPCRTGPCALNGAEDIVAHLEARLGIKDGETTPDGLFTLKSTECLGACGMGPVIQVGETYHELMTAEKADSLLEDLRRRAEA